MVRVEAHFCVRPRMYRSVRKLLKSWRHKMAELKTNREMQIHNVVFFAVSSYAINVYFIMPILPNHYNDMVILNHNCDITRLLYLQLKILDVPHLDLNCNFRGRRNELQPSFRVEKPYMGTFWKPQLFLIAWFVNTLTTRSRQTSWRGSRWFSSLSSHFHMAISQKVLIG